MCCKQIHSCFRAPYLRYYLLRWNCGNAARRVCAANRDRIDSGGHVLYTMENNPNLVKYHAKQWDPCRWSFVEFFSLFPGARLELQLSLNNAERDVMGYFAILCSSRVFRARLPSHPSSFPNEDMLYSLSQVFCALDLFTWNFNSQKRRDNLMSRQCYFLWAPRVLWSS